MAFVQKKKVEENKVENDSGEPFHEHDHDHDHSHGAGESQSRWRTVYHIHKGANPDGSDYIHEVTRPGQRVRSPLDDVLDAVLAKREQAEKEAKEKEEN